MTVPPAVMVAAASRTGSGITGVTVNIRVSRVIVNGFTWVLPSEGRDSVQSSGAGG